MYESITKGKAPALKMTMKSKDTPRKTNLNLLCPQLKS